MTTHNDATRIDQLNKFADWEVKRAPENESRTHIAHWAVRRLVELLEENRALKQQLQQLKKEGD